MRRSKSILLAWVAILFIVVDSFGALPALAEVRVARAFSSHMVLQREKPITIWGWATPGETVTVQFQDEKQEAKANDKGEWKAVLAAEKAGGPYTLTVSGSSKVQFDDVMVGEVWLCSGQSNMEMGITMARDAKAEIAQADHPGIRLLLVTHKWSPEPQQDIAGAWKVCSPHAVGEGGWSGFSAAAYYFGRQLHKELNVPIGLIESSWGGTRIESWTPPEGFAAVPALTHLMKPVPPHDLQQPTALYNGQIFPLVPLAIRGAIWYQGESNMGEGMLYAQRMKGLVGGWRQVWGEGDFPFYFAQIAPYKYGSPPQVEAELWEAQASAAQEIPNCGMAVINDIGQLGDIHPKNKQEVGRRLALLALAKTYGKDVVCSGPTFKSMHIADDKMILTFDNLGGGLVSRDGKPLDWFELIDADGEDFVKAEARIDGATVVVHAAGIPHPTGVRYAWSMLAEPNLANAAGLPAGAFRVHPALAAPPANLLETKVPEAAGYQLVYDLDLSKLGHDIAYTVDNHANIHQPFDRIAYFMELQAPNGSMRYVYVSMDAFTDDLGKIGVPTPSSGAHFQENVAKLNVISNVKGIITGEGLDGGNIEFWPNNYGPANSAKVPDASEKAYDFGDQPVNPVDGYGSMQIHNHAAKQTLFSLNKWSAGATADIGIGNSPTGNPDWTFAGNAQNYPAKRLRILVHLK